MADINNLMRILYHRKNVLLSGAAGTGKSLILNRIANIFQNGVERNSGMSYHAEDKIFVPDDSEYDFPFSRTSKRKVFRTAFHQNSKYRDFITGIVPRFGESSGFEICEGILYRANEFAKKDDCASLLIIDEINRGPAIEIFGDSIVSIEPDKRLGEDGSALTTTQFFELLDPFSGKMIEYALSPRLYIVAAMNQADVSVAPLDVAFLRRWYIENLYPDYSVLSEKLKANNTNENAPGFVYYTAIEALKKINHLIEIERGVDYTIGQGIFLSSLPSGDSYEDALRFVLECWQSIMIHLRELFYGDTSAIAFILNASSSTSPYSVKTETFDVESKPVLIHQDITIANILDVYRAILEAH